MVLRNNEVRAGAFEIWRADPVRFAEKMSRTLPVEAWTAYNYLSKLMRRLKDAINEGGARIVVSMPPRHGKSEAINFWFSFWLITLWPEMKILLASYAVSLPTKFTRRVRDMLREYGHLFGVELSTEVESGWITTSGGGMTAAGVDKGITGTGFDVGIIDDPVKDWKEAMNDRHLDNIISWFGSTFYTRCAPNASIIVIMTRWATRDLAGYLEHESEEEWEVIRLADIAEDDNDWAGRKKGEALCPERWPVERIEKIHKAIGDPKIIAGLYKQKPSAEKGGIFEEGWFKRWTRLPVPDKVIVSWDMSFGSQAATASWVVGQVWLMSGTDYYLVHQVRGRWRLPTMLAKAREINDAYGAFIDETLIEDKALGPAVMQQLEGELINIVPISPENYGNKNSRAAASSVAVASGRVYIPEDDAAEWVPEFVKEHINFPTYPSDDMVDTESQAVNYFEQQNGLGVWATYLDDERRAA